MAIDYSNPKLVIETSKIEPGSITWRSPSNLAIIKYWGKHGRQLPRNPSISFTLDKAFTETTLAYEPKTGVDQGIALEFLFEGEPNPAFEEKVRKFLESIVDIFPFLRQLNLSIDSRNSFPHSSGIASSASSMSALALCLCSLEDELFNSLEDDEAFRQKASYVARLGSGSACRSIYAGLAEWGAMGEIEGASDLYAIPYSDQAHEVFLTYQDAILIVSKGQKSVSSRAGHALMDNNPYAESRYQQARQRLHALLMSMRTGDLEAFGQILEAEALTLHALMMASNYILIKPQTLGLIEKVRGYRKDTGHPLFFSLDAGPNLHLLYPGRIKEEVENFIETELVSYCEEGQWIADEVGKGPLQL
ncbi:MAG: diphosphomevalonate decarboxylase [Phaeodactylibacter sp.]|nr:diphosphomevalonate decarboxylase [Phaeodactylibacter sp.]MCB9267271.1 diphosphomevalonate decarboxylase [Lewinellaceae bacterium]MCB9290364.1 diphosphomevalonate decarboxylase [Lewinellaceae bacterium]